MIPVRARRRAGTAIPAVAMVAALALASPLAASAEEGDDNPVVAIVNGEEIRQDEVRGALDTMGDMVRHLPPDVVFDLLLDRVIERHLIGQAAEAAGVEETEQYQRELEAAKHRLKRQIYLRTILEEELSEERLHEAYEERYGGREVSARHILVESREEAEALIAELEEGADFAELAREHSTGPSGPDGGDLGFFGQGRMVAPFADAAFALDIGSYTQEPVETDFGWHVIKVEDEREAEPPPFETVRDQLSEELGQDLIVKRIDELRATAEIEKIEQD